MKRSIQENCGSFSVNLPREIADDLGLRKGDILDFVRKGNKIMIVPVAPTAKSELQETQHLATDNGDANE